MYGISPPNLKVLANRKARMEEQALEKGGKKKGACTIHPSLKAVIVCMRVFYNKSFDEIERKNWGKIINLTGSLATSIQNSR